PKSRSGLQVVDAVCLPPADHRIEKLGHPAADLAAAADRKLVYTAENQAMRNVHARNRTAGPGVGAVLIAGAVVDRLRPDIAAFEHHASRVALAERDLERVVVRRGALREQRIDGAELRIRAQQLDPRHLPVGKHAGSESEERSLLAAISETEYNYEQIDRIPRGWNRELKARASRT